VTTLTLARQLWPLFTLSSLALTIAPDLATGTVIGMTGINKGHYPPFVIQAIHARLTGGQGIAAPVYIPLEARSVVIRLFFL